MASPTDLPNEEIPLSSAVIDVMITCISLPLALLILGLVKPHREGFFCDDKTIRLPYRADTVSITQCYSISYGVPILTILVVELGLLRESEASRRRRRWAQVAGWTVPEWALRCLRFVLLFSYGLGCVGVATHLAKITVGRLQPSFFAACKPHDSLCNATRDPSNAYVATFTCTGRGRAASTAAFSFPSAHASTSFFAAMFVVIYLENRTRWPDRMMVMKTAYETLVLSLAWFTSLSRIADNKHHWEDILAGGLIGSAAAWFWVRCVLRLPLEPSALATDWVVAAPSEAEPSRASVTASTL